MVAKNQAHQVNYSSSDKSLSPYLPSASYLRLLRVLSTSNFLRLVYCFLTIRHLNKFFGRVKVLAFFLIVILKKLLFFFNLLIFARGKITPLFLFDQAIIMFWTVIRQPDALQNLLLHLSRCRRSFICLLQLFVFILILVGRVIYLFCRRCYMVDLKFRFQSLLTTITFPADKWMRNLHCIILLNKASSS